MEPERHGGWGRRRFLGAAACIGLSALWPGAAAASRRARGLRELLAESNCCILGIPLDGASFWETVGGRPRIVTYSTVGVDQAFDAQTQPGDRLRVRTLGGEVDGIGQWVAQEARLALHEPSVLFLTALSPEAAPRPNASPSAYCVTGMAEGHYRLRYDAGQRPRLRADHPGAGELDGLTLQQLYERIARERADAP